MLNSIENERKRKDCLLLLDILEDVSKEKPELWNGGMIGFGRYEYKYESGREGSWFLTGFAPRKNTTVLYLVGNIKEKASKGVWGLQGRFFLAIPETFGANRSYKITISDSRVHCQY